MRNEVALFDDTVVHTIQILISDADYEQMITTYQQTGVKDYFHADVIIDGVRVSDVGLRLKGNASLRTALGGMGMGGRGDRPQFDPGQPPGRGAGRRLTRRGRCPNHGRSGRPSPATGRRRTGCRAFRRGQMPGAAQPGQHARRGKATATPRSR